jgi:hypothetical protein
MDNFRLVGHINVYRSYAAPVIPVLSCQHGRVAMYDSGLEDVSFDAEDSEFVRHDVSLCRALEYFDPSLQKLMALSANRVIAYDREHAPEFLEEMLGDRRITFQSNFIRLMLAEQTRKWERICHEFAACLIELKAIDQAGARRWAFDTLNRYLLSDQAFLRPNFTLNDWEFHVVANQILDDALTESSLIEDRNVP